MRMRNDIRDGKTNVARSPVKREKPSITATREARLRRKVDRGKKRFIRNGGER